jgi:putative transcriptional regulator
VRESKRKPLFERLKKGLKEGISHARGELALKTADVPEEPPEIDGLTLAALREEAAMTQSLFAKVLNVSSKTVQSWEQGVREPSMSSRRMIHIFSQRPDVVCEIVGLPGITLKGVTIVSIGQGRRKIVLERPRSIRKEKEKNS